MINHHYNMLRLGTAELGKDVMWSDHMLRVLDHVDGTDRVAHVKGALQLLMNRYG